MTRATIDGRLNLDRATYEALIAHARSDFPYEVCGLLAGADGQIVGHYRIPNATRSMTAYNMDPKALLRVLRQIDDAELDVLAVYHSHTHTEAFPSATDVELAAYPDAVYLIVSLQDNEPVLRGFDIREGRITERVLTVEGEELPTGPR